ncbi:hypothetical protein ACFL35_07410 [Candidatus Riflebacteria bacterium]
MNNRKNISLVILIAALAILFSTSAAVYLLTHQASFEGKKGITEFYLHSLIFSLHQGMVVFLEDGIRKQDPDIMAALENRKKIDFNSYKSIVNPLIKPFGLPLTLKTTIKILSDKIPEITSTRRYGKDPHQRSIEVEFQVYLRYKGIKREYFFRELFQFQAPFEPILSRFTLFSLEPENINSLVNNYRNLLGQQKPLVLINHPDDLRIEPDAPDLELEKKGKIYLGHKKSVLRKTGMRQDNIFSELFHFRPAKKGIAAYLMRNSPWPEKISIFRSLYGFSQDMILRKGLFRGFELKEGVQKEKNSAALHLFGTSNSPSPTKIMGPVYTRYCSIAILRHDLNQDGKFQGTADENGQPGTSEKIFLPDLKREDFPMKLFMMPEQWKKTLRTSHYKRFFTGYNFGKNPYRQYCTVIITEPYNRIIDFLKYDNLIPPKKFNHSLATDKNIRLWNQNNEMIFKGNLFQYNPEKGLLEKVTLSFKDQDTFFRRFIKKTGSNNRLNLKNHVVLIKNGHLELPQNLIVDSGGMILVEKGNISLHKIINKNKVSTLSLVSLKKDIILRDRNLRNPGECHAFLICLKGQVKSKNVHSFLNIYGGIATREFDPCIFKNGGTIIFDPIYMIPEKKIYNLRRQPTVTSIHYQRFLSDET